MENSFVILMSELKVMADNIKYLHKNIVGKTFFEDHEELSEIYEYFDEMADDVTETILAMNNGVSEISTAEASHFCDLTVSGLYTTTNAYAVVEMYCNRLIDCFERCKNDEGVKNFIASKWEEYQFWLFKRSSYMIRHLLQESIANSQTK